jgi:prepilin peptidase CpaA
LFQEWFRDHVDKYLLVCACTVAIAGAVCDARSRRIPNLLTLNALAAALITRALLGGWLELRAGLFGILVAGGTFLLIFLIRGMGGGDVKLIAAVGAWAGSGKALQIVIGVSIAGGLLVVYYLAFARARHRPAVNSLVMAQHDFASVTRTHPTVNSRESGPARVPFGVAIALGTLFCAGNPLWWR